MPIMRPSTCSGTPEIMCFGGVAEPLRPVLPHQIVIAADAAGGDDHRLRAQREIADDLARAALAALDARRLEDRAADAVDRAVGDRQRIDAVAEFEGQPAAASAASRARRSNGSTMPGPVPQVTWKRGTELPWPIAS